MTTHCPQGDDYVVLFEDGRYEYACEVCVEFEKERPHVVQVVELDNSESSSGNDAGIRSYEMHIDCPECGRDISFSEIGVVECPMYVGCGSKFRITTEIETVEVGDSE
ncbi:hypothetical protein GCM10009000_104670 [Halobacterium noricense]